MFFFRFQELHKVNMLRVTVSDYKVRSWCRWNVFFRFCTNVEFIRKKGNEPVCREQNDGAETADVRRKRVPQKFTYQYHRNPKIMYCN